MAKPYHDTYRAATDYVAQGWALVAIPAGSKAPKTFGWQTRAMPADHWRDNPSHNIGLLHSLSGTAALDIDHMAHTRAIFDALNIDLDHILASAPRIVGRPDRGKVLFRAPEGSPLNIRKVSWPVEGDPRRTEVVFELRAGTAQDVLPPSVHPETGNPYTWAGADWRDLPPIPEQLLTIWHEWDRFRPQMLEICPWAPKAKPPAPRRRKFDDEAQESIIHAWNEAHPIGEALTAAGYRQFGKRWLSPNSTSKIPGVVIFDDGRAYSHHASDPFDPAHSFDSFDVFTHYEHLGNVSAAVKAAGEALDIKRLPEAPSEEERAAAQEGKGIWEGIKLAVAVTPAKVNHSIPNHLMTIPGVLGDLVDYAARTAIKPQPQFDVQAALAFGATVMGRRWITNYDNMSSLFFLNIGRTASGKEHAKRVIERALDEAGLFELVGPSGYTSSSGVLFTLQGKPNHITIIDEFGIMLESSKAVGSVHKRDALKLMMEAWGRQTGNLQASGFSTAGMNKSQKEAMRVIIRNPSLTVLGMTTPDSFYDALSSKDVASGFLNRFLIVESYTGRQLSRRPERMAVPQRVIDWAQAHAEANDGDAILTDQGEEFPPVPIMVPFTPAAETMLLDLEKEILATQEAQKSETLASMLDRRREITMRLALIVARSLGDDEIGPEAVQWAMDYTQAYSQETITTVRYRLAEGEIDGLRKAVAKAIKDAGSAGLKMSEILLKVPSLGNLRKHERDGLLAMVCEDYPIVRAVQKPGKGSKGGRPAIIHTWDEDGA